MFRNPKEGDTHEPNFEVVLDYSLESIIQAFVVPVDWTFHVKRRIDLKKDKINFYVNQDERLS